MTSEPEAVTTWLVTASDLADYWPTYASEATDEEIESLLESARIQCEEYAPTLAVGAAVPENYRRGQALQARALWRSQNANASDGIGGDGLAVAVFPMDWTVKALLRPKTTPRVR